MNINKEKLLAAYKAVQGWVSLSCVLGIILMVLFQNTVTLDVVVKNIIIGIAFTFILAYTGLSAKIDTKIKQALSFIKSKIS